MSLYSRAVMRPVLSAGRVARSRLNNNEKLHQTSIMASAAACNIQSQLPRRAKQMTRLIIDGLSSLFDYLKIKVRAGNPVYASEGAPCIYLRTVQTCERSRLQSCMQGGTRVPCGLSRSDPNLTVIFSRYVIGQIGAPRGRPMSYVFIVTMINDHQPSKEVANRASTPWACDD